MPTDLWGDERGKGGNSNPSRANCQIRCYHLQIPVTSDVLAMETAPHTPWTPSRGVRCGDHLFDPPF
jgi:hypothetical protein